MARVVMITGASSGIGEATALALAGGWRLALIARRAERLHHLAQRIAQQGGEAEVIDLDLVADGAPAQAVQRCVARFGRVDALINNAGAFATAPAAQITAAHSERLWRLNVQAPMLLTAAALPHLVGRPDGNRIVVNVSSIAAESTFPGCGVYSATKAAIDCWSRILREELRGQGVRVAVVAPGATHTEAFPGDLPYDTKRMCRADDIAQVIRTVLEAPATASIDRVVVMPPGGAH